MEYFVNAGVWGDIFAVPKAVVDNYIKLANEASLKVLLYALRNNGKNLTASEISSALNIPVSGVEEAFVFWENANVIGKRETKREAVIKPAEEKNDAQPSPVRVKKAAPSRGSDYSLTPLEISERIEKSEEIRCLFNMTESSFKRPLTHTEHRSLIWMHDYLGLATDVILMLIAYCMSADKGNISYIERIACSWAEQGINTLEAAQEEVKRLEDSKSFTGTIMRIFGMNRRPTPKQQQFIDSWKSKSYSTELIEYAYEKTVESIDKVSFPYINSILENWNANGLSNREMVDSADTRRKKEYSTEGDPDLLEYKSLVNNFGD